MPSAVSAQYTITDVAATYVASGGATLTTDSVDDGEALVTLPFPFQYYGVSVTAMTVGVNGAVIFHPTATSTTQIAFSNGTLLTGMLAPFWDDFHLGTTAGPFGSIVTQTAGAVGSRTFTVEWREVRAYPQRATAGNHVSFQIVLFEGSNIIHVNYGPIVGTVTLDSDAPAGGTIGARSTTGSTTDTFVTPACSPNCNLAVLTARSGRRTVLTPPAAVCGDSITNGTEACDQGAANGTSGSCCTASCTLVAATTTCRASAGSCDVAEACDGTSGACPADGFLSSATVCRAVGGDCDVAESCTGSSAACPIDTFQVSTLCRAAAGVCDSAEYCSGAAAICPTDSVLTIGTVCRAAVGACDVAEACNGFATCPADGTRPDGTACADGVSCNGDETCRAGVCSAGTSLTCDDSNACTADMCVDPAGCEATPIAGCCNLDADCSDDGDVCTAERCSGAGGSCASLPITGCCTADSDCSGGSTCSPTSCNLRTNRCETTAVPGCCDDDADCGDSDACTTDRCNTTTGVCTNTDIADCCASAGDCSDGDSCTTDTCVSNRCTTTPITGCCENDGDCSEGDGDLCTEPSCNLTTGICAETATDCDDADACTVDACEADGSCSHTALDCDDADECTADACGADGLCVNDPIAGCGTSDAGMMMGEDAGMVVEDDAGMTVEVDAAMPPGVDGGPRADAATPRTDGGGVDAGSVSPDAAIDPMTEPTGCACSVPGRSERSSAPLAFGILAMIAGVLARRRR
ncbi:MAG: hypothetical protein J0L92_14740 [Deltaproteobacteria bacterium]|nr:hypothetical protein [Deltaproteobacteria bacterium]